MKKNLFDFIFMKKTPLGFLLLFLGVVIISAGVFLPFSKADPSSAEAIGNIGEILLTDDAYIDQASMVEDNTTESKKALTTGTEPFDLEYGDDLSAELKPGDDNSGKNNIVRTFDMVNYTINFTTKMYKDSTVDGYKKGRVYFEFIVPYSREQVIFDTQNMGWLESKSESYYKIIDLDHENEDGSVSKWQVLKGSFMIMPLEGEESSIGNRYRELNVSLRILRMKNKDVVKPSFTFWLYGNDVFQGQDFASSVDLWYQGDSLITSSSNKCHTHLTDDQEGIEEYKTIIPPEVTVTATPRYNIHVEERFSTDDQLLGTFDFSEGNELAQNTDKGLIDGRMVGFGITVELSGKSKEHGLFGVEIPTGDITFDLNLKSTYKDQDVSHEYEPLVYSVHGNLVYPSAPNGRTSKAQVVGAVPFNRYNDGESDFQFNRCFSGGNWGYIIDGDVLHITISDYVIDLNRLPYGGVSGSSTQYRYYNPNETPNYWQIQKAIFSSGAVWIVQDFYNSNSSSQHFKKYISDQYGDGSFKVTIEESNFKATSIGGVEATSEMITTDYSATHTFELEKRGDFYGRILPVKYNYRDYDDAITDDGDGWWTGRYLHTAGEKLKIEYYTSHDHAEGFHTGIGYDALVKWDDLFFEPDGTVDNAVFGLNQLEYKLLWGAKPNKRGWDHMGANPYEDDYDREMKAAVVDDLIYFESLDELKSNGYVPVALLIEHRGAASPSMNHIHAYIGGNVKKDVKTGYTYMATYNLRGWNKNSVRDLVAEKNGIAIASPSDYNKITDEMYDNYARQDFPSRSDPNIKSYDDYPEAFQIYDIRESLLADYYKAKYDENGLISGPGYYNAGLSCYVSDYMVNVSIRTSQSGINEDGSKRVYDLDEGQRIADFQISPSIITGLVGADGRTINTTITVEATLGKDLSYVDGSSKIGGTYQESTRGQGIVTGGKVFHPTVIRNEDGTTTLRWTLSDLELLIGHDTVVDKIYYSCQIGNLSSEESDVQNGQSISTTVKIRSREDYIRPYSDTNKNVATNTIYVQKSNALSLFNSADKISNELDRPLGFLMSYKNNLNVVSPTILVNGLPYNGDGHSSFHGDLKVTELSVGSTKADESTSILENFNFYYTTEESYRGRLSENLADEDFSNTDIWKKLELGAMNENEANSRLPNAAVQIPEDFSPVLIVAVGDMRPQQKIEMHITYQLPSSEPGDFVANYASQGRFDSYSYSYYISRMLEGKVWLDLNRNGLQGQQEGELPGFKVTLLKLMGEIKRTRVIMNHIK